MPPNPYSSSSRSLKVDRITAVLGPTNTGKTHLAVERMDGPCGRYLSACRRSLSSGPFSPVMSMLSPNWCAGNGAPPSLWKIYRRAPAMPRLSFIKSGDVDYLVATDVSMGLNMDIDHVAFAGTVKYDGAISRRLRPAEFAQIAGRSAYE